MSTPELGTLLTPLRAQVVAAGELAANHDDRRVRRRLRDLLGRLDAAAPSPGAEMTAPATTPSVEAPADGAELASGADVDALVARVRPVTEGRRVLFVSNRLDAELDAKLVELLGVRITGCEGSLRRVQAACSRIGKGSYDMVLSATGFQVHGTDAALARAAKAANVPYVRVDRGRPLTCVQAIARELGLVGAAIADGGQREAASRR